MKINNSYLIRAMFTALQSLQGLSLEQELRSLQSRIKDKYGAAPHKPTGIAKARRVAKKRQNISARKAA